MPWQQAGKRGNLCYAAALGKQAGWKKEYVGRALTVYSRYTVNWGMSFILSDLICEQFENCV